MKILVTSFVPWNGDKYNSSEEAVNLLPKHIEGAEIVTKRLPVSFERSITKLEEYVKEVEPDVILLCGQAEGREDVTIETQAKNFVKGKDVDGKSLNGEIIAGGEKSIVSTVPAQLLYDNVLGLKLSDDAGAYVCNYVFYTALANKYAPKIGFIHVPLSIEQAIEHNSFDCCVDSLDAATVIDYAISFLAKGE